MSQNSATAATAVSRTADAIADLGAVYGLVEGEFRAVNQLIPEQLTSDVAMVEDRDRAAGEAALRKKRRTLHEEHHVVGPDDVGNAGVCVGHDDVVDHSGLRRGKPTANQKWGNAPSVLVGDFLYSRAFQLMVDLGSLEIMGVLSHATNTIAEGEVMQLANIGNCALSEAEYREVIRCKTALLFEAASHTGALLASQQVSEIDAEQVESMRRFGLHFGLAYQLLDDWLDYRGNSESMGKNVGDDLAEGKLTLPLIYALENADATDQAMVRDAIDSKNVDMLGDILRIVDQCGALAYTRTCAQREIETALHYLNQIPDNDYQQALMQLSHYSLSRLG